MTQFLELAFILAIFAPAAEPVSVVTEEETGSALYYEAEAMLEEGAELEAVTPMLEEACALNHLPSCTRVGRMLYEIAYSDTDKQPGLDYMISACDRGFTAGCNELGEVYRLADDDQAAIGVYDQSCTFGDVEGCKMAGFVVDYGSGREADLEAARDYYQKACDLDDAEGCYSVGVATFLIGGPDALANAKVFFERALELDPDYGPARTTLEGINNIPG